jgi:hypothetical protein
MNNIGSPIRARYTTASSSSAVVAANSSASSQHAPITTRRRAVIATLHTDTNEACLLWDADTPRPLIESIPFRIVPHPPENDYQEALYEETVLPLTELLELFDFERIPTSQLVQSTTSIVEWKDFGDRLYRCGDFVSAVSYYEYALHLTSTLQVGCTVYLPVGKTRATTKQSRHGPTVILAAEVDCIDEGDADINNSGTVDVTLCETGQERVVPIADILLCRLGTTDFLQERVVLNLTRSLLQLATMETATSSSRRVEYLKQAIVATTLALAALAVPDATLSTSISDTDRPSPMVQYQITALILRSRAQEELRQIDLALADIQTVVQTLDPQCKQALAARQRLLQLQVESAKLNKRLVRNVSQWVQTAMNQHETSQPSPTLVQNRSGGTMQPKYRAPGE